MKKKSVPENDIARWWGLSIILMAITCVAWILSSQVQERADTTVVALPDFGSLTRFSNKHWLLPNEPLLGLVEIPSGRFFMGSDSTIDRIAYDNERWSNQRARGVVELPAFYISRYEVTRAQFLTFLSSSEHPFPTKLVTENFDHPITDVTWTDALAYCRWLEAQLRMDENTPQSIKELLNQGWTITLPNEAQWEKAARGTDGRIFPWGNNASQARRVANIRGKASSAVGSFACTQCSFGLSDMSGNVWELTRSSYMPYPFDPNAQPDLDVDALFVMRGGSYADAENNSRSATRGGIDPGARSPTIGFRIVLSPN